MCVGWVLGFRILWDLHGWPSKDRVTTCIFDFLFTLLWGDASTRIKVCYSPVACSPLCMKQIVFSVLLWDPLGGPFLDMYIKWGKKIKPHCLFFVFCSCFGWIVSPLEGTYRSSVWVTCETFRRYISTMYAHFVNLLDRTSFLWFYRGVIVIVIVYNKVLWKDKSQHVYKLYRVFIWHPWRSRSRVPWSRLEPPALARAANKMPDENMLEVFYHVSNCIHVIRIRASYWWLGTWIINECENEI